MRITINETSIKKNGYQVNFSTEYGNATALWNGNVPEVKKEYFAEIEIPGILCWQKDISTTDEKCFILLENNIVHIVALLESIEDDGYTVLRLGDSIITIQTQGKHPNVGSNVKITTNNLLLYEVTY